MHNNVQEKRSPWIFITTISSILYFSCLGFVYAEERVSQQAPSTQPSLSEAGDVNTLLSPDTQDATNTQEVTDIDDQSVGTADPYETFNRSTFILNDKVDVYIMKPIATVYNKIIPKPLNAGIHNFFLNIGNLPTIANDILQLHFYQALSDLWRLTINTTIGIGGLFDVAARIGLDPYTNDFGLTLARWGYANSNYLVLPLFGPSSPRDTIGLPVDYFAFSIYPRIHPQSTRYQIYGLGVVDKRAQLLQYQTVLEEAALDQYVFVRNAYLQHRAYQMEQNQKQGFLTVGAVEAEEDISSENNN